MKQNTIARLSLLIFVLWALFLSFEFWGFGETSYVKIPDAGDSMLASRLAIVSDIANEENGHWNPNELAGLDRTAQDEWLGPIIDALFLGLPGWLAYGSLMFLQRFIAGYFTYKLLVRDLSVSPILALFPALFFALFSERQLHLQFDGFTVYDGFGGPALPMVLFFLGSLASSQKTKWRPILLALLLGALYSASSSYVLVIFSFPLIAFWLLTISPGSRQLGLMLAISFFLGWFVIELPQMAGALLHSGASHRDLRESCTGVTSAEGATLVNILRNFVFKIQNLPALALGIGGFVYAGKGRKAVSPENAVLVLLVSYVAFAYLIPLFACSSFNPIGFIQGFNFLRFTHYFPFLICIFSGVGAKLAFSKLDQQGRPELIRKLQIAVVVGLVAFAAYVALGVKQILWADRQAGSNYANLYLNPYLTRLAEITEGADAFTRAATLPDINGTFFHPAYVWPSGVNTIDGYTAMYSSRFAKFWELVIGPMMQAYPECRYGLKHLEGNNRVYLSNHCDYPFPISNSEVGALFDLDLLSMIGTRYFVSDKLLNEPRLDLIDTSDIGCDASIPGCLSYQLYENPDAFPAAFFVSEVQFAYSEEDFYASLSNASLDDLKRTAYMLGADYDQFAPTASDGQHEVTSFSYSHDQITVSVAVGPTASVLVLNTAYSSDWKAWINGQETAVFPVNLALMGVEVPAGSHTVELKYLPIYSLGYWAYRLSK